MRPRRDARRWREKHVPRFPTREGRADARREARGSDGFERATTRVRRATPHARRAASSARAARVGHSVALSTSRLGTGETRRATNQSEPQFLAVHLAGGEASRRAARLARHTAPRPHRAVDVDHGVARDDVGERARARSPSRRASSRRSRARARRPRRRTVGTVRHGGRPPIRCLRAPRARRPSPIATPRDQPSRHHRRDQSHRFRGRRRRVPRPDAPRPRDRRRRRARRRRP